MVEDGGQRAEDRGVLEVMRHRIGKEIRVFARRVLLVLKENIGKNLVSLCLFGSATRSALRDGSDIDFLVVLSGAPESYHKRVKLILPLVQEIRECEEYLMLEEKGLRVEPSFLLFTEEEVAQHPPILLDISNEGIILYDRESFLGDHLRSIGERLREFQSIRKDSAHGHYWVLKPDIQVGESFDL